MTVLISKQAGKFFIYNNGGIKKHANKFLELKYKKDLPAELQTLCNQIPKNKDYYIKSVNAIKKKECNLLHATRTTSAFEKESQPQGECVVLDSLFITSSLYLSNNINPASAAPLVKLSNIHIPNPFVFNLLQKISSFEPEFPNIYDLYLGEFLKTTNIKIKSIFADWTSTFSGRRENKDSRYTTPQQDLEILFSRKLLLNNSILSLTCSTRENRDKENIYEKTIKTCTTIAENNGYTFIPEMTRVINYKGLYFITFWVVYLPQTRAQAQAESDENVTLIGKPRHFKQKIF